MYTPQWERLTGDIHRLSVPAGDASSGVRFSSLLEMRFFCDFFVPFLLVAESAMNKIGRSSAATPVLLLLLLFDCSIVTRVLKNENGDEESVRPNPVRDDTPMAVVGEIRDELTEPRWNRWLPAFCDYCSGVCVCGLAMQVQLEKYSLCRGTVPWNGAVERA